MQLSEIKNDLATINYSPEINRLVLGDFILIEDTNQSILSQIVSIEATLEEDVNSAMLKFLLSIDKEANLTQYSGYVPAKNATLILINPEEVVQLIKGNDKNIHLGNLAAYPDVPVELSLDFLRKKTYIQVDFLENKLQIVKSIIKGLEKHNRKTLLFDFQGLYEGLSLPTVTLGYNFKLPLNYDALCYIAEEELNDFGNDNKAIIQGILIEVQNYVKTIKDEFIPFDTLISVLDAQYEESPLPELLLLKNKLIKYQQQGLFAQEKSEFDFLDSFLKDAKNFKFDLSELPSQWHKIAFSSILNIIKTKCYLITDFSDDNSNKNIIKRLYEKSEFKPIVISSYNYKYQLQLKSMSKNMILFKPIQKVNDFAGYTSFLNILSQDTFITWGEQTLYIPLILKLQTSQEAEAKLDKTLYKRDDSTENEKNQDIINSETSQYETDEQEENYLMPEENPITEEIEEQSDIEDIVIDNSIIDNNDYDEDSVSSTDYPDTYDEDVPNSNDMDFFFDSENTEFQEEPEETETFTNEDFAEVTESLTEEEEITGNNIEENQNDVIMDLADTKINEDLDEITSASANYINDEDIDEISNNIDELMEQESNGADVLNETEQIEETSVNDKDNNIPVSDVTEDILQDESKLQEYLTDEEQSSNEVTEDIEETEYTEEEEEETAEDTEDTEETPQSTPINITKPAVEIKTPPTTVYTSDVAPQFDTKFAQGTYVHHPKYGRGVVEKVINYGSKELCMIIFDNDGRKLLDPNLAELKQI